MLTLYGMTDSGNCYKPRLAMAKLGIVFRHVEIDTGERATRTPEFLALNPNGKVPVLDLGDGRILSESNAILLYLCEGTRLMPVDAFQKAQVWQWMFFEQYSHEPSIAVRRSLARYPHRAGEATPERMAALLDAGHKALAVMEKRLADGPFLVGDGMSAADIALFAYTQDAGEAGFDLDRFPAVEAWLERVRTDAGHVPLEWTP